TRWISARGVRGPRTTAARCPKLEGRELPRSRESRSIKYFGMTLLPSGRMSVRGHARTAVRHSPSARSEGRGPAKRPGLPVFRPQEQPAENEREEKESGHVTQQVTAMLSGHRLNRHDAAVHDARPHCEPDQAAMGLRVSRRIQQEDAERRVYPDDHHEILGFIGGAGVPRPAGGPTDHTRLDQQEGCAEYDQGNLQESVRGHQFPPLSESLSEVVIWEVWGSIALTFTDGIAVSLPGSRPCVPLPAQWQAARQA